MGGRWGCVMMWGQMGVGACHDAGAGGGMS